MHTIAEIFSKSQLQLLEQDTPTPLYYRLYTLLKNAIIGNLMVIKTSPNASKSAQINQQFGENGLMWLVCSTDLKQVYLLMDYRNHKRIQQMKFTPAGWES